MLEFKKNIDLDEFDDFARNHELSSINQSIYWPKIKHHWKPFYSGLYQDGTLVATAIVLIRKLGLGMKFAYVPKGPLMDYSNREIVEAMIKGLRELSKQEHCLFVRMDPKVLYKEFKLEDKNQAEPLPSGVVAINNLLKSGTKHHGFPLEMHAGFQPRFVANVYQSETFEKDLPKKTKQSIRNANRRNVTVRRTDKSDLDAFVAMLEKTEERKDISLRTKEYHENIMDTFGEQAVLIVGEVDLHKNYEEFNQELTQIETELQEIGDSAPKKQFTLEEKKASLTKLIEEVEPHLERSTEKQVLSGMLAVMYGNTFEHLYVGFDDEFKRYMPQYKLYTEAIKFGFEQGYKYSNMGGIEGTLDDGLTEFKNRFNPMINEYIGEFDVVTSPLYPLFMIAWKLRDKIKNR